MLNTTQTITGAKNITNMTIEGALNSTGFTTELFNDVDISELDKQAFRYQESSAFVKSFILIFNFSLIFQGNIGQKKGEKTLQNTL